MDEVHYLADRFRGAVWEEVIIHLAQDVRLVSLSATVSNAEEFGDWLGTVRGDTEVIVSETRPVPLEQHVLVRGDLLPLFDDRAGVATAQVNQELMRIRGGAAPSGGRQAGAYRSSAGPRRASPVAGRPTSGARGAASARRAARPAGGRASARTQQPPAGDLLHLQPCRVRPGGAAGAAFRPAPDRRRGAREIREVVEERTRTLPEEDLAVLGYWEWRENLERGVAAHHAGLLPAFKEVVEELFQRKLVKAVFATETLALGINMPARTVVLEKLEKFNGEARVRDHVGGVHPADRARGAPRHRRRGARGHPVDRGPGPAAVAALASRRTYPLHSSFRPTYNMAVNLIDRFGRARTREILESRSRSSRPTAPSSVWRVRCGSRRSRSRGTRRPWPATAATSPSTPASGAS